MIEGHSRPCRQRRQIRHCSCCANCPRVFAIRQSPGVRGFDPYQYNTLHSFPTKKWSFKAEKKTLKVQNLCSPKTANRADSNPQTRKTSWLAALHPKSPPLSFDLAKASMKYICATGPSVGKMDLTNHIPSN